MAVKVPLGDLLFELLEAFPDLEYQIADFFTQYILDELTEKKFRRHLLGGRTTTAELGILNKYTHDLVDKLIDSCDEKGLDLWNAYYDVARYMTSPSDAAEQWDVEPEILELLLTIRPAPKSKEKRWALDKKLTKELRRLREPNT